MKARSCLAAALMLWLLVFPPGACADTPASAAQALALPDGSPVQLTGLLVDKVAMFPPYVVVRDAADSEQRLIVLFAAPPDLRRWQTVNVAGTMTTLPNGYRAIDEASVAHYTDAFGLAVSVPIPVAGLEQTWPFSALSELLPVVTRGGGLMLEESEGMPTPDEPEVETLVLADPEPGTIPYAKSLANSAPAALEDKVVTRSFPTEDAYYIEEQDRTSGIRVVDAFSVWSVYPGALVTVTGDVLTNSQGERYIDPTASVTIGGAVSAQVPFTLRNKSLGGTDWRYIPGTGEGQRGVTGESYGLNNVGLFVRTTGRITDVGSGYFYVDDGSGVSGGGSAEGVRVEVPGGHWLYSSPPMVGDYLTLTGVSGLSYAAPACYPLLRMTNDQADRQTHCTRELTVRPILIPPCADYDDEISIAVEYTVCGAPGAGAYVYGTIGAGDLYDEDSQAFQRSSGRVTVDPQGIATFRMKWADPYSTDPDMFTAQAYDWGNGSSATTASRVLTHERGMKVWFRHAGWAVVNQGRQITVLVTDLNGNPLPGISVTLTTSNGTVSPVSGTTSSVGELDATVTPTSCPELATITATATANPCELQAQGTQLMRVLCQTPTTVDIWFCIDTTGSMSGHLAHQSVVKLVQDLQAASVPLRLGGVKFNEEDGIILDDEDPKGRQIRYISEFSAISTFVAFLSNEYRGWAEYERQIEALHYAAQDVQASGGASRLQYIVLVTDEGPSDPNPPVSQQQLLQELTGTSAAVYLSLWETPTPSGSLETFSYQGFNVNGGLFDPVNPTTSVPADRYPFALLREDIIGGF